MAPVETRPLSDVPEAIPALARWFAEAWPAYYAGRSLDGVAADFPIGRSLPWILPAVVLIVGLIYFSIGYTGYVATLDWNGFILSSPTHVGAANVTKMVGDPVFWNAVGQKIATRNLWLPIGLHFAWNYAGAGVFGTAVSGEDAPDGLIESVTSGPALLSGGDFGPEGSLYAVGAGAVLTIVFMWLARRRGTIVGPRRRRTDRAAATATLAQ